MRSLNALTWNDKLALIDHYKPSEDQIIETFKVTKEELATVESLRKSGILKPNTEINYSQFQGIFDKKAPKKQSNQTSISRDQSEPLTATKRTKRRGRQGTRIVNAFNAIPYQPIPVKTFIDQHHVSLAVLRQTKRFDSCPEKGRIHIRKDRDSGELMIWRDKPQHMGEAQ